MNTPNNKRRKNSQEKIERAFVHFLQTKEINENIDVNMGIPTKSGRRNCKSCI